MGRPQNILITGVPRSGTTLLTTLLHAVPNCVALSEPLQLRSIKDGLASPNDYARRLVELIKDLRREISEGRPMPIRRDKTNRTVASNYWRRVAVGTEQRMEATFEVRQEACAVETADFTLCIKNCGQFTSCLEALTTIPGVVPIAVIRHPVPCLLSWRSLSLPVSNGRLKFGEQFHPELRRIKKIEDALLRQVRLLDWYFEAYHRHRERLHIIRYEDLVQSPDLLRRHVDIPADHTLPELQSMNQRPEYDWDQAAKIREYLRLHGRHVQHFYPPE
jgi:hypothetical protein